MSRVKINDGLTKYQRYHLKNKEKRNEHSRAYHKENREVILNRKKRTDVESKIRDKHNPTVYLIVNENYVGTTEDLKRRLWDHKFKGRDVSNVEVLGEFLDRKEALELERSYHDKGYEGKHKFNTYK